MAAEPVAGDENPRPLSPVIDLRYRASTCLRLASNRANPNSPKIFVADGLEFVRRYPSIRRMVAPVECRPEAQNCEGVAAAIARWAAGWFFIENASAALLMLQT